MNKIKLTELNKLDSLQQNELLKITGGAAPSSGCCCSCDACSCTEESCDEDSKIASSYNSNTGDCVSLGSSQGTKLS
jgi:hypothetical protein